MNKQWAGCVPPERSKTVEDTQHYAIRAGVVPPGAPLRCEVCGTTMTPAEVETAGDVTAYYATCDRCQDAV
jgi:hypothetical protein